MNIYEYKQKTENTSVVFYSLLPTCGLYRDFPKNITDNITCHSLLLWK